jgi:hypothetical protein
MIEINYDAYNWNDLINIIEKILSIEYDEYNKTTFHNIRLNNNVFISKGENDKIIEIENKNIRLISDNTLLKPRIIINNHKFINILENSNITLDNIIIEGCKDTGSWENNKGACISLTKDNSTLRVNNCTFINNTAEDSKVSCLIFCENNNFVHVNNTNFYNNNINGIHKYLLYRRGRNPSLTFNVLKHIQNEYEGTPVSIGGDLSDEKYIPLPPNLDVYIEITLPDKTQIIRKVKTNDEGMYEYTYLNGVEGYYHVSSRFLGNENYIKSNLEETDFRIKPDYQATRILLDNIPNNNINNIIEINGILRDKNDNNLPNKLINIKIKRPDSFDLNYETTTNDRGYYHFDYVPDLIGNYNIGTKFKGDTDYGESNDPNVDFNIDNKAINSVLTFTNIPQPLNVGDQVLITGVLKDIKGPLKNENIRLTLNIPGYDDEWDFNFKYLKTNNNGVYEFSFVVREDGEHKIDVQYLGTDKHILSDELEQDFIVGGD